MSLCWDWETRSVVNLKTAGVYLYSEHPLTDALLASFKLKPGDTPAHRAWTAAGGRIGVLCRWRRGEPCPPHVRAYVAAGGEISAFNAAFERLIWWNVMSTRHGWPKPKLEQFRCTAVTAAAMSLPRSLDRLGAALDLAVKKDKRGEALMKIHSIPRGFNPDGSAIWHPLADDPVSLAAYHDYCDTDVLTEEEAAARLIPLSDAEMRIYWLNERVNDRGLRIDVVSARAAMRMATAAKEAINTELTALTGDAVTAFTQTARLKAWIEDQGVVMPSMDKDDVDDFLHDYDDLPDNVRRALELRAEGAKPSVDKIAAMLRRASPGDRVRGCYLHHGAGQTGRFSSRGGVQAHNMPKYRKVFEDAHLAPESLYENIRSGDPSHVQFMYGPELGRPLHLLSDAVRGFIWAAPGHELVVADYSSIEGRTAAWFANETWKLEAFKALDRGEGYGIYEMVAAFIYGIPIEAVQKNPHRVVGKLGDLACLYMTGVGGIRKFARQNKVKLALLYPTLWGATDEERREHVDKSYIQRVAAHDPNTALGREGWIAAELIKLGWRAKHPNICAVWPALEEAAINAVQSPGQRFDVIGVSYLVANGFLWCRLPSGRCLAYGAPKMAHVEAPWADKTLEPEKREKKLSLTVRGVDAVSEKWVRFPVYGGSLLNNVNQGTAADILRRGMLNIEARGWPVVLHTHDEVGAEVKIGSVDPNEYAAEMCRLDPWAATLPLTANAFVCKRYRKD